MAGTGREPPSGVGHKGIRPLEAKFLDVFLHACMTFAASKGLSVAKTSLYMGSSGKTLLVERFDRVYDPETDDFRRAPMLSALTLLDAEWKSAVHKDWHYAALADELYRRGAGDDRPELYKRMPYNALVGNADDHPRNHAVIWQRGRWRLSPMYDVMPVLGEGLAQTLSMALGSEGTSIGRTNMLSECRHFGLKTKAAEAVLDEVASWESELKSYYETFLVGADLAVAVAVVSGARLRG